MKLASPERSVDPPTYAVCTRDRAISPVLQRAMAARTGRELDASHSPFLSRPDVVARLLTEIVATSEVSV